MKKNITKLLCIINALILLAVMAGCTAQGSSTDSEWQSAPELRVDSGYIQWRSSPDAQWQKLIALSEIKGEAGPQGETGLDGSDGTAGSKGDTGDTGDTGAKGSTGAKGATGPAGTTGSAGADGREIEIQNDGSNIQWRYKGETSWTNLIALSDITGAQGAEGVQGIQGLQGIQGIQGPSGEDGTVSAYAQYTIVSRSTTTSRLSFGGNIQSTDSSLISNPSPEYISLTSGHCYLITYNILMLNTESAFTSSLYPSLTDLVQITDSFQYDPHGQVSILAGSFIVNDGGLLWFDLSTDYYTSIIGDAGQSIVTILCLD